MTDSEEELPTVGYRWRDNAGVEQATLCNPEEPIHRKDWNQRFGRDELVKRSDVLDLIDQQIDKYETNLEKSNKKALGHWITALYELREEVTTKK